MRNPNIIKTVNDVMASIERYESAIKDFVVGGGAPPNDEDKCNIIISKLPEVIQDNVMFKEFTSFAELKRFLQEHTQLIKDLGHQWTRPWPSGSKRKRRSLRRSR